MMYAAQSYKLTTPEFNYLLPAIGRKKFSQTEQGEYLICYDVTDLLDILNRLKGFYGKFDELPSMIAFKCSMKGNLNHFRELMQN